MIIQTEHELAQVDAIPMAHQAGEIRAQESPLIAPVPAAPLTQAQMKELAGRLASGNRLVHDVAERDLFSMDSVALTRYLAFERQMRRRKMNTSWIVFFGIFALLAFIQIFTKGTNLFVYFGMFAGLVGSAAAFSKTYKTGVMALSRFENTDSVGELIPALEIRDAEVQQAVQTALIKLLPQLRASDRKINTEVNRRTIIRYLQGQPSGRERYNDTWIHTQLTLGIVTALQQIGDNSYTDVVSRLAAGRGRGVDPEIAAAARECLPYLRQHTQESIASSELVRASSANGVGGSDTLLRAVSTELPDNPGELLRAGDAGKSSRK